MDLQTTVDKPTLEQTKETVRQRLLSALENLRYCHAGVSSTLGYLISQESILCRDGPLARISVSTPAELIFVVRKLSKAIEDFEFVSKALEPWPTFVEILAAADRAQTGMISFSTSKLELPELFHSHPSYTRTCQTLNQPRPNLHQCFTPLENEAYEVQKLLKDALAEVEAAIKLEPEARAERLFTCQPAKRLNHRLTLIVRRSDDLAIGIQLLVFFLEAWPLVRQ